MLLLMMNATMYILRKLNNKTNTLKLEIMKNLSFEIGPKSENITSYYVLADEEFTYEEALVVLEENTTDEVFEKIEMIEEQEDSIASYYNYKYCMVFHDSL